MKTRNYWLITVVTLCLYSPCNVTLALQTDSSKKTANITPLKYKYVASKNSKVFHYPGCSSAKRIKPENLIGYRSWTEATKAGRRPCKRCKPQNDVNQEKKKMNYQVLRLTEPINLNGGWDKQPWQNIAPLELKNFMGQKPEHFPKTQAKLTYDNQAIYIFFRVEDRYVRAIEKNYHGNVCKDSCVEFFFTPGPDITAGYFNLEVNCGGTMLFHYQTDPDAEKNAVAISDCRRIKIFHNMPKIVEPEISTPTTWLIQYRLPYDILEKYAKIIKPAPGVIWRANFYKIASWTSHPHWLTWSFVDYPKPKFHAPQFFGILHFM